MAYSKTVLYGDGENAVFALAFSYLNPKEIKVSVDGVLTDFEWNGENSIKLAFPPQRGALIEIYRYTSIDEKAATFNPGSGINAKALNANFDQTLMKLQEHEDILKRCPRIGYNGITHFENTRLTGVKPPMKAHDAATKGWTESLFISYQETFTTLKNEALTALASTNQKLNEITLKAAALEEHINTHMQTIKQEGQKILLEASQHIETQNRLLRQVEDITRKMESQVKHITHMRMEVAKECRELYEQHKTLTRETEEHSQSVYRDSFRLLDKAQLIRVELVIDAEKVFTSFQKRLNEAARSILEDIKANKRIESNQS